MRAVTRVAALYDIHGNLPALDAVLEDVRRAEVDCIVVGGDVVPGPWPRESLQRLLDLPLPVHFIHGNCERAALAQLAAPDGASASYWGTVSGRPLPEPDLARMRWSAERVRDHQAELARWPRTLRLAIAGLGDVLFCHATPRSETEVFTRRTADERLAPLLDGLGVAVLVCGHTHMQFDRRVGRTRIVNAGSVGDPVGSRGAFWAVLHSEIELRRTAYDVEQTAARIRQTEYPASDETARGLIEPPSEPEILDLYSSFELTGGPRAAGVSEDPHRIGR